MVIWCYCAEMTELAGWWRSYARHVLSGLYCFNVEHGYLLRSYCMGSLIRHGLILRLGSIESISLISMLSHVIYIVFRDVA